MYFLQSWIIHRYNQHTGITDVGAQTQVERLQFSESDCLLDADIGDVVAGGEVQMLEVGQHGEADRTLGTHARQCLLGNLKRIVWKIV